MNKIAFNRKFKFWFYQISHSEALLRSPIDQMNSKNIDIYFDAVDYIEIPYILNNLSLEKAEEKDVKYISEKLGKDVSADKITVLICEEGRFYIIARLVRISENELDPMELPLYTNVKGIPE